MLVPPYPWPLVVQQRPQPHAVRRARTLAQPHAVALEQVAVGVGQRPGDQPVRGSVLSERELVDVLNDQLLRQLFAQRQMNY